MACLLQHENRHLVLLHKVFTASCLQQAADETAAKYNACFHSHCITSSMALLSCQESNVVFYSEHYYYMQISILNV